jgi:F-type H+-transporting ATPase subunit b
MNLMSLLAADPAVSKHWLWPEPAEIIYGGLASLIVFGALYKFAMPVARRAMADRTAKIQKELDASASDLALATDEAVRIRQAKGDIASERARILAEADAQTETILNDGRARVQDEIAELEAKADAEIAAATARQSDELRGEIARISSTVIDRVAARTIDSSTQNDLVESFIAKVGAS